MRQMPMMMLLMALVAVTAYGQSERDSLEYLFASWYDNAVGQETNDLMYGGIYATALRGRTTHQYLDKRDWQKGNLILSGELYVGVSMLFDIEREQLVVKHPDDFRADGIKVKMENVRDFTLANHHFVKLDVSIGAGFYDVLFEGDSVTLLAKRKKRSVAKKEGVELEETTRYFIPSENRLVQLRGVKTLFDLFPEQRLTIKSIKKDGGPRLKLRKEEAIVHFIKVLDDKLKPGE